MILWSLIGAFVLLALVVLAAACRGLMDSPAQRKLTLIERRRKAWAQADEIRPLTVGRASVTPGGGDGRHGADTSSEEETCRSTTHTSPLPQVQRAIECRELLNIALRTSWQHPEQCPIFIHSHQADERGQEKRN